MPRLPPAEKLPLAARKNLRDGWEGVKDEKEKSLSETLGQPWTIDIDALAVFPYGEEGGWARNSPGDMISSYVSGAEDKLKYLIDRLGPDFLTELNDACTAHVLTMDVDEDKLFNYCGCKISPEGQLVILFGERYLGTNIDQALDQEHIEQALNNAPTTQSTKPLNYQARKSIAQEYTSKIPATEQKLASLLGGKTITLNPNFEAVFAKLAAAAPNESGIRDDWAAQLGPWTRMYFESFVGALEDQKFGQDDMLQEGLLEAMEKNEVVFRVVDELKKTYNETVIEDGVFYLQTTPKYFGANIADIANDLIDML